MATLSYRDGRCVLTLTRPGGGGESERKTISAGRMSRRAAEQVRQFVGDLEGSERSNTAPRGATAEWLAGISATLHARLAAVGLVRARADAPKFVAELDATLAAYIDRRTDLKPGTRTILQRTRKSLVKFFGPAVDVAVINKADAQDWHRSVRQSHSVATAHLYGKKARQMFADAVDRGLCRFNPFVGLKLGASNNPERMAYVSAEDVQAVIDATYDREWKLLFGLARFGAARIPSEVRQLKWTDVDLSAGRMTLRSPKTEHHAGRASRVVPIAPALYHLLIDAVNNAADGAVYVLPRLRLVTNHATTGRKIIERAGLVAWDKTFQNLRSSCETDWMATVPLAAACAFAGNTPGVALKHYFQVTDAHFAAVSAAPSAADIPGLARTSAEHAGKTAAIPAGNDETQWLPRSANLPRYTPLNPQILHDALRKCMRRQARRLRRAPALPASPVPFPGVGEGRAGA